ncbi:YheC/YheD family protein [Paenibacillus sp. HB172176]|uniref:YheC/YheD family protein n=1 Tax=Paenibacillus sp. HB172176 TaxID=2493690 RepID=UPI00143C4C15|nr:YheC/YheD family protein [Paenibacillus sp. HB172176]
MTEHHGRQLASKWAKTEALLPHPSLAPHIPPTYPFNSANLRKALYRHGMVILKPVVGSGGHGLLRIVSLRDEYVYSYRNKTVSIRHFPALIRRIQSTIGRRPYLIQKGINLAKVNGKPIDYRVKYVLNGRKWEYRAVVGRIAKSGLFVTNLSQGGEQVKAAEGIRASLGPSHVNEKKRRMKELTAIATSMLVKKYPGIAQLGYDFGIDKKGKIWLFEVNTRPH